MHEFWEKHVTDYIIGTSDAGYCYHIVNFCAQIFNNKHQYFPFFICFVTTIFPFFAIIIYQYIDNQIRGSTILKLEFIISTILKGQYAFTYIIFKP